MINVVTVKSGWILQKIAERLVSASGGRMILSHEARNDVDANYYVDVSNCFHAKSKTLDIGMYTHVHADDPSTIDARTFQLDFIVHMCERYRQLFIPLYPAAKMNVLYPGEITAEYTLKKPTLGIFQRGQYEGKGYFFMQELARHPIAQHFKFLFVGGGWTDVIRELDSRQITVEHHDDANYQAYPGLYDRCDYLLIPSLWEGGPMSLIEAYAKGLPIISSDVGSVPDFGVDYLYPTGNLEALAKILDSLLEPARQRRAKVESLSYKKYADDICALVERIKNNMVKLNLGCGNDYREGWINVDSGNCRADIHFDIAQANWKIESDSVDYVVANHIVEHIDRDQIFTFLKELYRVCRHGAEIHIIAPYAGSDNFWTDPTHRFPMTLRTFDFFDKQKALSENGKIYGWDAVDFTVVEANYLPNPPNGPDLKYLLRVNKPTQS